MLSPCTNYLLSHHRYQPPVRINSGNPTPNAWMWSPLLIHSSKMMEPEWSVSRSCSISSHTPTDLQTALARSHVKNYMPDVFRLVLAHRTARHVGDVSIVQNGLAWNQALKRTPTKNFNLRRHIQLLKPLPNCDITYTAPWLAIICYPNFIFHSPWYADLTEKIPFLL